MTNLIPPTAKKELVRLYWIRVVSAWALLWSVCLLIGGALLLPTYVLIAGTSGAYSSTVASATERTEVYDGMVAELELSTQKARRILQKSAEPQLSHFIEDVWKVNGQGVAVNSIKLTRVPEGIGPIIVTGQANDRQTLAAFRDRIEALPYVGDVNLPIGDLAQNQDIIFSITITINQTAL